MSEVPAGWVRHALGESGGDMSEYEKGWRATERGATVEVDLIYPRARRANPVQYIEVGLEDVRAADSIRVHYDFERDGWAIEQASTFGWEADDKVCDSDWQEVAFVQAWAREKREVES